ncbi:MAG TPA: hypothetical protein VLF91_02740 [Candidatus Saccharimonadales bacterium]|nr:hypothetical protein [Candidatus Saccharimonadales bacterium]
MEWVIYGGGALATFLIGLRVLGAMHAAHAAEHPQMTLAARDREHAKDIRGLIWISVLWPFMLPLILFLRASRAAYGRGWNKEKARRKKAAEAKELAAKVKELEAAAGVDLEQIMQELLRGTPAPDQVRLSGPSENLEPPPSTPGPVD